MKGVRPTKRGVEIRVQVQPGAAADAFPTGFDTWRGGWKATVAAAAQEGQANAAVCRLVAKAFGVPARDVAITKGAKSRMKVVHLDGMDLGRCEERLACLMPNDS